MGIMMRETHKVVIIHGWSYSHDKWSTFITLMTKVGFNCELLRVPGLTGELQEIWTLDNYVDWLDSQLSSKDKYILLGHSNGGRIALAYAHKYPKKVARLVLIASAGIIHRDYQTRIKKLIFGTLAKIGKRISTSKRLESILYTLAREQDYHQASPSMKQTMINLINTDIAPLLPSIKVPAILIWGKCDRITPLGDGQMMHSALPHSALFTLSTAKHSPQFTHAQETVSIIYKNIFTYDL